MVMFTSGKAMSKNCLFLPFSFLESEFLESDSPSPTFSNSLRDSFLRVTKKGEKQSRNELMVAFHLPLHDTRDNIYCDITCVHRARAVLDKLAFDSSAPRAQSKTSV